MVYILGHEDRRAYAPDFNPFTNRVEPGYNKRMQKSVRNEERRESCLLKKLHGFLENTGITKNELKKAGYLLTVGCKDDKFYNGRINGKCFGLDEGRLKINKKSKEVTIRVVYKGQWNVDHAIKYNRPFIENQADLARIESAIKLRDFLDKKKIPYKEEPSKQEVKNELNKLNNRVSGLIKKL